MKNHHSLPESDIQTSSFGKNEPLFQWIMRLGVIFILALGFIYLMVLNALATSGFDLEALKSENLELKKTAEKWDIEIAIPTSLYALESLEQVQAMDPIQKKTYLYVKDGAVAFSTSPAEKQSEMQ